MDDDLDIDSVLFGGSDPPVDGSFDPWLPGLGQERTEDDSGNGTSDHHFRDGGFTAGDDDAEGVIRYGRFGGEGDRIDQRDDGEPLPWQGATDRPIVGAAERREREAADTGNRNVTRTAEERTGRSNEGGTRTDPPRLASSINAAAERIRADIRIPLDARERSAAVIKWEESRGNGPGGGKIPRTYERKRLDHAPQFMATDFEATLAGLKANTNGIWIITLTVAPYDKSAVYTLDDAYGLALDVHVQRKRMAPDNDVST